MYKVSCECMTESLLNVQEMKTIMIALISVMQLNHKSVCLLLKLLLTMIDKMTPSMILLASLVICIATTYTSLVNGFIDNVSSDEYVQMNESLLASLHTLQLQEKQNCNPWMFRNKTSGLCECSDIPNRAILCDSTIARTSVLDCYCMTFNSGQNEMQLGRCLYGCGHKTDTVYYKIPRNTSDLNSYTCGRVNKDSTLCGACKYGLSPLVYSYDMSCMNCTGMKYNWIKYIAVAYIPITFFFLFVVVFRFSGTSPLLRGFITGCQGFVSAMSMRAYLSVVENKSYLESSVRAFGAVYGIWNLDFFRTVLPPICLDITPLQALALDYAVAFYPLLLVIVTYIFISLHSRDVCIVVWLWKPFHKMFHLIKKDWDFEGSIIKAFATFFVLSYLKILNVTFDLLIYTEKYTLPLGEQSYQTKYALYYDGSVEYFQGSHLYYGVTALLVGLFVVILPLVFLVIYPKRWFQKCLNYFHIQRQSIDMFVDCYQGYYKDGTDGTRDCRCFSIEFFLLQIIIFILFTLSRSIYCFPIGALFTVLMMFLIFAVQPYKKQFKAYCIIDALFHLLLAAAFIISTAADEADVKAIRFSKPSYILIGVVGTLPLLYLCMLICWWIFIQKNLKQKLPCFQVRESIQLQESFETDYNFLDRRDDPQTSPTQATPLLSVSQEN